ncbi:MAG: hypothetical protein VX495_01545 [Nitrospinota bacterium]|nr:hypothetical protein [Nitrospinota bacterium]
MVCQKNSSKYALLFLLAYLFQLINTTAAWTNAADPVSIKTQVDITQPTLGDILIYSIRVNHDSDIVIHTPEYVIPEGFEKVGNGKKIPRKVNNQTAQEFWLKLRVDKTGLLTIPAIPLGFDAPDQNNKIVKGKIMTAEVNVDVQSLLQLEGKTSDIKDIKPIFYIKAPWVHYIWKALGVLCLLALAYFIWKNWQKKADEKLEPLTLLTAEQKALKELQELKSRELMKLGLIREHFFELSEIFRRYMENRYRFPAQEWTTEEIISHFKGLSDLNEKQKLQARTILTESDKVKFAKAEVETNYDPIEPVIHFIKEATPPIQQEPN